MEHLLKSQTDLRLEVLPQASDQAIQTFNAAAQQLPVVETVTYVTKQQAYEAERKRDPNLVNFLEQFRIDNPFPDTFRITLNSLEGYEQFSTFIRSQEWSAVVDPAFLSHVTDQEVQVFNYLQLTQAGGILLGFFFALAAVILLFLLIEWTRRRALLRREEITVERLVGANNLTTVVPFATEASLLILIAVVSSAVLLLVLLYGLPLAISSLGNEGAFAPLHGELSTLLRVALPGVFTLELLLAPLLAIGAVWLGLRPQLRTSTLSLA